MRKNKKLDSYIVFREYISEKISSANHAFEQVMQFNSKYFKADQNLFRFDVNLLSEELNPNVHNKKLYIVLRNTDDTTKEQFETFVSPYRDNGFSIKVILLCNMKSNNNIELDDLILIDDSLCITAETKEKKYNNCCDKITTYHISDIYSDEYRIKKTRNLLFKLRHEVFRQSNLFRIQEPLSESADISFNTALKYCNNGIMSTGDCTWYHSVWQYLRIIDKVSSPEWHSTFYEMCFNKILKHKKNPKILISGTADYSLLAYVYSCIKSIDQGTEIYVLDTCKTPLKMCKWYAEKYKFNISVINMSVLNLDQINEKFDLICADAFLTRFSKSDAKLVVRNWYKSLNPYGMVVTTVRTKDERKPISSSVKKDNYIKDCLKRFQKWEGYFEISMGEFEDMVKKYVENMVSHNLGNKNAIKKLFIDQGFVMDEISNISDTPGELEETAYYEVCCIKEEISDG